MSHTHLVAALPFDVRPGEVQANLQSALDGVRGAASSGARLLVLPEKWTTSFLPCYSSEVVAESELALASLHEEAESLDLCVIGSAPAASSDTGGGKPFNQVHYLGAGGLRRPYHKRILFSPTGEGRQVARGDALPITLETPVGRVCAVVCYDLRFPEVTREAFYQEADLLVVPAQWPLPRLGVFDLLARARACESQMWVLACNRAGVAGLDSKHLMEFPGSSSLIDPMGEVVTASADGELLVGQIDLDLSARVKKIVPCARDLKMAGLWPE
ncbi:MAG: hypothetical protein HOM34_09450, partial [Planctomycetes bacterium]|nr:hypothetical protein [Planctomycetota bacterium]